MTLSLTQAVHRSAQSTPREIALVYGTRRTTFADVRVRVAQLSGGLGQAGVQAGDRVAILAPNSDRYILSVLATAWLGAVVVPLNTRWSEAELAYALGDSGARALVFGNGFHGAAHRLAAGVPGLRTLLDATDCPEPGGAVRFDELLAAEAIEDRCPGADSLAGLFYTGGTTGRPKGVMLSHQAIVVSALGAQATGHWVTPKARFLHAAPMFHIADFCLWTSVNLVGGTHVVLPGFDPGAVLEAIERESVTDVLLVPTMLQALVDQSGGDRYDASSLRRVIYGASPVSEATLTAAIERFPRAAFTQGYGMTELAPMVTVLGHDDHVATGDRAARRRSAGLPAPHVTVEVVDEEGRGVAPGTVGEVVVRSGAVMLGYWGRPDETDEVLQHGTMRTGDGGYLDSDGYLYVVDRIKDMIVTGGENVYSTEVENAITQHPAVAACAVIGLPDDHWGERIHAVVVRRSGQVVTEADLREHARALIGGYKVPRSVEFVDALPVSGAGKVLKRELRRMHGA